MDWRSAAVIVSLAISGACLTEALRVPEATPQAVVAAWEPMDNDFKGCEGG